MNDEIKQMVEKMSPFEKELYEGGYLTIINVINDTYQITSTLKFDDMFYCLYAEEKYKCNPNESPYITEDMILNYIKEVNSKNNKYRFFEKTKPRAVEFVEKGIDWVKFNNKNGKKWE